MKHTMNSENKKQLLTYLYKAQIESLQNGDIKAHRAAKNAFDYFKLDPADPKYSEKLGRLHKRVRFQNLVSLAEEVVKGTGNPMCFEDAHTAISDAIDAAAERFEHTPCPKHAAALLGLIDCRNALIEINTEESEEVDESDPEEEDDE